MRSKPRLLIVIPTYGHFDYAARAARSALEHTLCVEPHIVFVDDASPEWLQDNPELPRPLLDVAKEHPGRVSCLHFAVNGGLTSAWNSGLCIAHCDKYEYACVTNSDVLFTLGWDSALIGALERGADLVGPVTNAPGTEKAQHVCRWFGIPSVSQVVTDDEAVLCRQAGLLWEVNGGKFVEGPINGFCMLAKTSTWWGHKFGDNLVFKPRNDFNSRGQKNPTPLMTLQEYELQGRWRAAGLKIGFCPGSLVFHYRSVSRGERHKSPGWYRPKGLS